MLDAIEALRNINFQHVLRPKLDAVENGFDGIPTRASWTKAIGMRRQFGLPFGLQSLAHERLSCPISLGWNAQRPLVGRAGFGYPCASERGGLALKTKSLGQ